MKDTIFVSGATGFLGTEVVGRLLAETEADIYVLVRDENEEAAAELRTQGLELNKKALEAFQATQDKFFYDSDFSADYGQVQTFNNLYDYIEEHQAA